MTNEQSTEALVQQLAQDLKPVRQIPRLWVVATLLVALSGLTFAVDVLLGGQGFRPVGDPAWGRPTFWMILSGLGLAAIGGVGGALASSIPGRSGATRLGVFAAAGGLSAALLAAVWEMRGGGVSLDADAVLACLSCMGRAAEIGLLSLLAAASFIAYAAALQLRASAALAVFGSIALGAALVHLSCPSDDPLHHLVSHVLTPVAAATMITAPLAAAFKRLNRRREQALRR